MKLTPHDTEPAPKKSTPERDAALKRIMDGLDIHPAVKAAIERGDYDDETARNQFTIFKESFLENAIGFEPRVRLHCRQVDF